MVQTADSWRRQDFATQARVHRAACWRLLRQTLMRTVAVIVRQIFTAQSSQMLLIQRNDVIHHLSSATADPAFRCSVLPRTSSTRSDRYDSACFQYAQDVRTEFGVSVEHNVAIRTGQRESLTQLLYDPFAGRMRRGVKVQDPPPCSITNKQ
jgi:hypothetical protein